MYFWYGLYYIIKYNSIRLNEIIFFCIAWRPDVHKTVHLRPNIQVWIIGMACSTVFESKWNPARWCNYDGIDFWFNLVKCRTSKTKIYFEYISRLVQNLSKIFQIQFPRFQLASKILKHSFHWNPDILRLCPAFRHLSLIINYITISWRGQMD